MSAAALSLFTPLLNDGALKVDGAPEILQLVDFRPRLGLDDQIVTFAPGQFLMSKS